MEGITLLMLADDPWSDPILQFCKIGTASRCGDILYRPSGVFVNIAYKKKERIMRFEGQVAIVTGGVGGLGKEIVRRLASEGARVVVFDMDEGAMGETVEEFAGEGYSISSQEVDVTDEESVSSGVEGVAKEMGWLDIMINCAGILGPNNHKITEVDMAAYDATLAVNLRGSYLMAKYSLAEMEKRDYGRVLLIASIAGKEGNAKMSPYSISKAGVIGLVKSVGKEYAETGITVNALAPAAIYTSMIENADPAAAQYMIERIPMKRFGKPEELAATAAWIVSPEASFNTGFTFDMSGGRATY